jgi:hypothetical protein
MKASLSSGRPCRACGRPSGTKRGYRVMLAEANTSLGGRVAREGLRPGLSARGRVAYYRTGRLAPLSNVDSYHDSHLTPDDILAMGADHAAIATASHWRRDTVARFHLHPYRRRHRPGPDRLGYLRRTRLGRRLGSTRARATPLPSAENSPRWTPDPRLCHDHAHNFNLSRNIPAGSTSDPVARSSRAEARQKTGAERAQFDNRPRPRDRP